MKWTNHATWNIDIWVMFDKCAIKKWQAHKQFNGVEAESLVKSIWPKKSPGLKFWESYDDVDWDQLANVWNERKSKSFNSNYLKWYFEN